MEHSGVNCIILLGRINYSVSSFQFSSNQIKLHLVLGYTINPLKTIIRSIAIHKQQILLCNTFLIIISKFQSVHRQTFAIHRSPIQLIGLNRLQVRISWELREFQCQKVIPEGHPRPEVTFPKTPLNKSRAAVASGKRALMMSGSPWAANCRAKHMKLLPLSKFLALKTPPEISSFCIEFERRSEDGYVIHPVSQD